MLEDEGRVLQVSNGIPNERSNEEMISLGETVQDQWQLTLLWCGSSPEGQFQSERESLWQNQRLHDSDSDRTFWVCITIQRQSTSNIGILTSVWSPIADSKGTQQESHSNSERYRLGKGVDMSKKKKDDKSGDHPKTWANSKSESKRGKYNRHMMYHTVGMTTRAMKMLNDC